MCVTAVTGAGGFERSPDLIAHETLDSTNPGELAPDFDRLARVHAVLEIVLIPPRRAGICPAVHSASPLPRHRRRLARRSLAGPGSATRAVG